MKSAVQTTILRALHRIETAYLLQEETFGILDRLIQDERDGLNRLATNFTNFITAQFPQRDETNPVRLLTLSNSSTICSALANLFNSPSCPPIILTILESRPLLEGLNLAKSLLPFLNPKQFVLELTTDASAAYFSSKSDLVIIGSDQIDPTTGSVKNKIGSKAVAKFAKRTICVTSTDKLAAMEEEVEEENGSREVSGLWSEGVFVEGEDDGSVKVRNVYFEWVEGEDVEGYVTERGILVKEKLLEIFREREKWLEIWKVLDQ